MFLEDENVPLVLGGLLERDQKSLYRGLKRLDSEQVKLDREQKSLYRELKRLDNKQVKQDREQKSHYR
jgi:hypothetical protein